MDTNYNDKSKFLHFIPQSIGEAIIVTDLNTNVIFINYVAEKLTDYFEEEVVNKRIFETFKMFNESSELVKLHKENNNGEVIKFENWSLITKDGERIFIAGSISPMKKESDEIIGLIFIIFNITKQRQIEENLQYMSMHDALTGLYNRSWFEEKALHMHGKDYVPTGIIVCDLDGLKIINDSMGHKAGDGVIKLAGKILKDSFEEKHMIARIGGDEFVILMPRSSKALVEDACRRIKNNVEKYNETEKGLPLSVSIGFSVSDKITESISDIFQEADSNMYKEKLHNKKSVRGSITKTIMHMIKENDFGTEGHCTRMKNMAELMGYSLGFSEDKINDLKLFAEFHDIGKIGISKRLLQKKDIFNEFEMEEMRSHCEKGQQIASSLANISHIAHLILKHHEWWNGKGYPLELKGEHIPIECRIISIIDAYDAMTNERHYRKTMSQKEAIEELKKGMGTQFDPLLVSEFIRTLKSLKVYVACSLKDAMINIKNAYLEENPTKDILLRFDASGTLKRQIENGSTADIFISAACKPMDELQIRNLINKDSRKNLLRNRLVLIASKKSKIKCVFKELREEKIKQIAIGDPEIVPAGKYAYEVLKSLGILESVTPKLVVAKNARDVLTYVEEADIDVGIVYLTDAMISSKVKILDFAYEKLHSPVVYPIAIMKNTNSQTESEKFIEFLTTSNAIEIFNTYGFIFYNQQLNEKVLIDLLAGNF